jgi:molybdate transport system substrate-binding protein
MWALLLPGSLATQVRADEVQVAVAANFRPPMQALAPLFSHQTGYTLRLSFGSSGKFYAQIRHGAPFQVFLSADQSKPEALERDGLAVTGTRVTYAIGALALWSAQADQVIGPERLAAGNYRRLSLANPALAPYGAAAVQVLARLGLHASSEAKWVQGENIAQAYQFVHTGNAELGFVALSQILDNGQLGPGSAWVIPPELHSPIRQDMVLLKKGERSAGARALMTFMQGNAARKVIANHGYRDHAERRAE